MAKQKAKSKTIEKKTGIHINHVIAVLLVAAVAVTGLIILRSSKASDGGYCDQKPSGFSKVFCKSANEAIEPTPDFEYSGSWTTDNDYTAPFSKVLSSNSTGNKILSGPLDIGSISNVQGKNLTACWSMKALEGGTKVIMVISSNEGLHSQQEADVPEGSYNDICIWKLDYSLSAMTSPKFDLYLTKGSTNVSALKVLKSNSFQSSF